MQLRKEDGEFSTGAWVTAAFAFTGLAVGAFEVPIFERLTALILFWVFIALASMSALAAVHQHGIGVGRERQRNQPQTPAPTSEGRGAFISMAGGSIVQSEIRDNTYLHAARVPPAVSFIGTRFVFVYRVFGGFELHGDDNYQSPSCAAVVAEFEIDPSLYGTVPDIDAALGRITFSQGGTVRERIGYACWLGEGAHASFRAGDTRSLMVVVRLDGQPVGIDCSADTEESNNLIVRPLEFEPYDVTITLLLKDGNYQNTAAASR